MKKRALLIGAGSYGIFLKEALADFRVDIEIVDGLVFAKTAKGMEKAFREHPIDYVILATPNYTHYNLVSSALRNGKHVLCEKPLALTLSGVSELYDLAKEHKRYLGVGFVLSNHPFYHWITGLQSEYGSITKILVHNHATEATLRPEWYWKRQKSGGWFMISEIHWYHLLYLLTDGQRQTVRRASEEKVAGRTRATFSEVTTSRGTVLQVHHRLDASYKTAWTHVEIFFGQRHIVIDDWVPRSIAFPDDAPPKRFERFFKREGNLVYDRRERKAIYQALVRENVRKLLEQEGMDASAVLAAHATALAAQIVSDEK